MHIEHVGTARGKNFGNIWQCLPLDQLHTNWASSAPTYKLVGTAATNTEQ